MGNWAKRVGKKMKKHENCLTLWWLKNITYIIIKEIEINICCKFVSKHFKLTFYIPRLSKYLVICLLLRYFRKPLAYIGTHFYSATGFDLYLYLHVHTSSKRKYFLLYLILFISFNNHRLSFTHFMLLSLYFLFLFIFLFFLLP